MCISETLISGAINTLITASVTRLFIFLTNKKMQKARKEEREDEKEYERRFKIFRDLLENAVQIVHYSSIDFKFLSSVSAFNMLLTEFKDDDEIMKYRQDFLDAVRVKEGEQLDQKKCEEAAIRLAVAVGRRINISVDYDDIQNKTYWPYGFNITTSQKHELLDLQVELLEKIDKGEISLK